MSVHRPTVRRPNIPEITRPSVLKRKRLVSKTTSLSKKKIVAKTTSAMKSQKKSRKVPLGTCYLQNDCKKVIAKEITKQQCKKQGGKSWKKVGGVCEGI